MTNQSDPGAPLPVRWAAGLTRELPAVVRAHLVDVARDATRRRASREEGQPWPSMTLVIHTEAMPDEFASLGFGTYIVEWFNPLIGEIERLDAGFFTGESLSKAESEHIANYCQTHHLTCMTRREWLEQVFFTYGYYSFGAIVGFNLPYILSRLATRARAIEPPRPQKVRRDGTVFFYCRACHQQRPHRLEHEEDGSTSCTCTVCHAKPGFRLKQNEDGTVEKVVEGTNGFAGRWKLVFNEYEMKTRPGQWRESAWYPSVLIQPISPKAAKYRWGRFDGWKEKSKKFYPGHFLDLRTLGYALSKDNGMGGDLWSFGELFGAPVLRNTSPRPGQPLDDAFLDDAMNGAEATLSLYRAELDEYHKHDLKVLPDRIYSGASLGKAYLQKMGLEAPPPLDTSATPYTPDDVLGFGMSSYYSGRSEGQLVRVAAPVTYVDFHSMYPAVCILQGLWYLMKAESIRVTDATQETIELLKGIRWKDLYQPQTWQTLLVLCRVHPEEDVLPSRADFRPRRQSADKLSYRIAVTEIESAKEPMWWTLADCIASTLQTGRPPRILYALKFSPAGARPLRPISIRGGTIMDPNREDFFRVLVDARDALGGMDQKLADALKIVVNSIGYGIWAEVNVEEGERLVTAYSTERRPAPIPHDEKPGRYYEPPFAALITSGARLLLVLLEHEVALRGGVSAFCDTDSLSIVSSEKRGELRYLDHEGKLQAIRMLTWAQVDEALQALECLNPYGSGRPLIKLEPENFEDGDRTKPRVDLHAYIIAAKRYFLFVPPDRMVKASRHTLGIVEPPRDEQGKPVTGWIEQLGQHVVRSMPFHPPWAQQPVEVQVELSRPEIEKSFRRMGSASRVRTGNKWMDNYLASVKPFNRVAVLAKSEDKFSIDPLESDELKGVPVIAPITLAGPVGERQWVAKNSGKPVYLLPPEEPLHRTPGMTDEGFEQALEDRRRQRQALIQEIRLKGGLYTTYKTFAELMADYQGQHESKALDLYGREAYRETKGLLVHPRVRITGIYFTGKETVLQEEVERGIVSAQEADRDRFLIPPERDEAAELVVQVLSLLPTSELKVLKIGWRAAEKLKDGSSGSLPNTSRLLPELIEHLRRQYPDEVGNAEGEAVLHAFMESREALLERWQAVKPGLAQRPTKELAEACGCSRREAIRIKQGEVEPSFPVMRRIVAAFS